MRQRSTDGSETNASPVGVEAELCDTLASLFGLSSRAEDGAGTLRMFVELVRDRIEDDRCAVEVFDASLESGLATTIIIPRAHLTQLFEREYLEYEGVNPERHSPFYFTIAGLSIAREHEARSRVAEMRHHDRGDNIYDLAMMLACNGMLMMNVGSMIAV